LSNRTRQNLLRREWKKRKELTYAMSLISLREPKGK
jgi:hypothetical protein